MPPYHLRPHAPYAAAVLLPGDPGRALALAQQLLVEPKMSNHHRGLRGYSGETEGGRPLSIQSTGMGAPSAAIVLAELAELGVGSAIRVGTCGALDQALGPRLGVTVACVLAVSDVFPGGKRRRIADRPPQLAVERIGADAARALEDQPRSAGTRP